MKKLRYFKCKTSQQTIERFVRDDQLNAKCDCGSMALKQLSAPKFKGNSFGKNASWSK